MINHIEDVVQSIFLKEGLLQVLEEVYFACSVCLHAFFYSGDSFIYTAGYVSMDNLQKYSGDLSDFHPGCVRCSNCKGCLPHL